MLSFGNSQGDAVQKEKKVRNLGDAGYGKKLFEIPGFDGQRQMKALVRDKMKEKEEAGDRRFQSSYNQWGKVEYPVFKGFALNKGGIDRYEIHPEFLAAASDMLKGLGYDVSEMTGKAPAVPQSAEGAPGAVPPKDVVKTKVSKLDSPPVYGKEVEAAT